MSNLTETKSVNKRGIYLLPNLFTISAMFFGFYAIILAMQTHFEHAALAIFMAMFLDSLDGRVARLTQTQTIFGAELDSLSDLVGFGLGPGLVLYLWQLHRYGKVGWIIAFVYMVAVALRLARFNSQPAHDKVFFKGMPCPAPAGLLAALLWNSEQLGWTFFDQQLGGIVLMTFMAGLALLMVSNVPFHSFKEVGDGGRVRFTSILLLVAVLVMLAIAPGLVIMTILGGYTISGPILSVARRMKTVGRAG